MLLLAEQAVMHFPEFVLLSGTTRRPSGLQSIRMNRQRQVAEKVFHLAGLNIIGVNLRINFTSILSAKRAFKIGVFNNRNLRGAVAFEGFAIDIEGNHRLRGSRGSGNRVEEILNN